MQDKFISVTVLNQYIHDVFVAEEMLRGITLCGEVSGLRTSGGHAYFVMKDANAQVQCCCFRYAKTYLPKEGETVLAKGSVDYYAKGGRLSFNIDEIKPFGEGLAALKLAQLKQRLLEEGYFDDSHKVAIPEFCSKICVLTSASGAVIRDIVTTVRKVNNVIDIVVRDIPVQGAACADAVVRELAVVDKLGFDAIVIARGGGSAEDLMPFNEEKVVKAVYAAKTPIISAVGHETDFTLCDFAADVRAATPTAAAQLVAYDVKDLIARIEEYLRSMYVSAVRKQQDATNALSVYGSKISSQILINCSKLERKIEVLSQTMSNLTQNAVNDAIAALKAAVTRLSDVNPANILAKGYFAVSKNGKRLSGVAELVPGDEIEVRGADGQALAKIEEVKKI